MRSIAASQPAIGTAQLIGVQPMKRMSAAKQTETSSTQSTASPAVWAGPTSKQLHLALADRDDQPAVERLVGRVSSTPLQSKGAISRPAVAAPARGA